MALKDLTTPTLVSLLDAWLDPSRQRPLVDRATRARTLLPDLEAARDALTSSHAAESKAPASLAKAQKKAAELDARHDRKARGLDKVLDGLSELTDDDELVDSLRDARLQVLGPGGLGAIKWSYTDEATNARLADDRITPTTKALLVDLRVGDRTAMKWVKEWQAIAGRLGDAEAERAEIEASASKGSTPADAVKARNKTIRVTHAFLDLIELDAPTDDARAAILGPLELALAKATRRTRAGGEADAAPAPAPGKDG